MSVSISFASALPTNAFKSARACDVSAVDFTSIPFPSKTLVTSVDKTPGVVVTKHANQHFITAFCLINVVYCIFNVIALLLHVACDDLCVLLFKHKNRNRFAILDNHAVSCDFAIRFNPYIDVAKFDLFSLSFRNQGDCAYGKHRRDKQKHCATKEGAPPFVCQTL